MNEYGVSTPWHENERHGDVLGMERQKHGQYMSTERIREQLAKVLDGSSWLFFARAYIDRERPGYLTPLWYAYDELERLGGELT